MVSSAFQAMIGEEIAGMASDGLVTQLFYALLRIVILSATFVLAHRTFNAQKPRPAPAPSRFVKASLKKTSGNKGKRRFDPPSEDEDAVSTSVGSSDSESDLISSDDEKGLKGAKISISELLRCRPTVVGIAPQGSLHTMPIGTSLKAGRSWETVRSNSAVQVHVTGAQAPVAASKVSAKEAPKESKLATSKAAKAGPKPPCKAAPVSMKSLNCASSDSANPARIQALLSIICPDEEPVAHKSPAKTDSAPWRRQASFPPGLEPSPSVP